MNTYANKTGRTLYTNTGIEKRNIYHSTSKRLHKNIETTRRSNRSAVIGNDLYTGPAVDTIIKFFKGTVVNGDASGVEWGTL